MSDVTGITDKDMTHFSNMLVSDIYIKLKELHFFYCNITDNGVQYICDRLTKNQTFPTLDNGHSHIATERSSYKPKMQPTGPLYIRTLSVRRRRLGNALTCSNKAITTF